MKDETIKTVYEEGVKAILAGKTKVEGQTATLVEKIAKLKPEDLREQGYPDFQPIPSDVLKSVEDAINYIRTVEMGAEVLPACVEAVAERKAPTVGPRVSDSEGPVHVIPTKIPEATPVKIK